MTRSFSLPFLSLHKIVEFIVAWLEKVLSRLFDIFFFLGVCPLVKVLFGRAADRIMFH